MTDKNILHEQIEYYRARAEEYDRSISGAIDVFKPATIMLTLLGKFNHILELACGTGFWTKTLLQIGEHIHHTNIQLRECTPRSRSKSTSPRRFPLIL